MPKPNIRSLVSNSRIRAESFGLTEHFSESDLILSLESCGYRCLVCGKSFDECLLSVDHVVPLSRNGTNDKSNIQILCRKCNSKKNVKTIDFRHNPNTKIADLTNTSKENKSKNTSGISFVSLTIPKNLLDFARVTAKKERRSVNSQIVFMLMEARKSISDTVTTGEHVKVEVQPPDKP